MLALAASGCDVGSSVLSPLDAAAGDATLDRPPSADAADASCALSCPPVLIERPDHRCGPSFANARCDANRCCSTFDFCGSLDDVHCTTQRGHNGRFDGPRVGADPCVDPMIDRVNCGACGNVCAANELCVAGACVCPVGSVRCGAECVSLATSTRHCGACGNACAAGQVCAQGVCSATCLADLTSCGGQCVHLNEDAENCGACGVRCLSRERCSGGVCVSSATISSSGCADGVRDAFEDVARFPNIAGCSGAWSLPGIFPAPPRAAAAACVNLGDDNPASPANGEGCAATNLCAPGWHVCNGGEITPRTGPMGCAATALPSNTFFMASVSGNGCFRCFLRGNPFVTGCDPVSCGTCGSAPCQVPCPEDPRANNDTFGCGAAGFGTPITGSCDGLNASSGDFCRGLTAGGVTTWQCGTNGAAESRFVTKNGAAGGGVLCCRD